MTQSMPMLGTPLIPEVFEAFCPVVQIESRSYSTVRPGWADPRRGRPSQMKSLMIR
jgi:hypothetical protein